MIELSLLADLRLVSIVYTRSKRAALKGSRNLPQSVVEMLLFEDHVNSQLNYTTCASKCLLALMKEIARVILKNIAKSSKILFIAQLKSSRT